MSKATDKKFGQGWISGTASVALATLGLLAVFCFHFPSYLTIPDAREYYPLPIIRALLHLVLVAAFLLGLTSVMLRQNKWLGMSGCIVEFDEIHRITEKIVIFVSLTTPEEPLVIDAANVRVAQSPSMALEFHGHYYFQSLR